MQRFYSPSTRLRARMARGVVVLATGLCILPAVPVHASEAPVDTGAAEAAVRPYSGRIPITRTESGDGRHLVISSALSRGYHLRGNREGLDEIIAIDLQSGAQVASSPLLPRGYGDPIHNGNNSAMLELGGDKVLAVDEENARLFLATQTLAPPPNTGALSLGDHLTGTVMPTAKGQVCAQTAGSTNIHMRCLNGVSVLDAETLELIRHIPLPSLKVDGAPASPQLYAMSYAPPFEGQGAKIHMVLQDLSTNVSSMETFAPYLAMRNIHNITYLVQLDVEAGVQDWAVRLDSCRGNRLGTDFGYTLDVAGIQRQAAVFRSRIPGEGAVYVACLMNSSALTAGVVRVPLDAHGHPAGGLPNPQLRPDLTPPSAGGLSRPEAPGAALGFDRPLTVEGPDQAYEMLTDPPSGRIAIQVMDGNPLAQVWWVFDARAGQFIGSIGIGGPVEFGTTLSALSPNEGRLYVLADEVTSRGRSFAGGLFIADIRRTPLAQALTYPHIEAPPGAESYNDFRWTLTTQELKSGGTRVWYPNNLFPRNQTAYVAIDDLRPGSAPVEAEDDAGRTLDLPEREGLTARSFDGAARGYGVRALLVGFAEAAARIGPVDPVGSVYQCNDPSWGKLGDAIAPRGGPCQANNRHLPTACTQGDREIVLAAVGPSGPSVVDPAGARGAAQPVLIDSRTIADSGAPVSRCTNADWDSLWRQALFGRAPVGEPRGPQLQGLLANCVSPSGQPGERTANPVVDGYHAEVRCEEDEASGFAYTRGASVDGVQVAEALSSFRIYLDPGRGIVSRVESVARGISLDGGIRIDGVRGVAESWANGRRQPVGPAERDTGYQPNCDFDRTAGTCFQRHLFGLQTPMYSCGPCGDEQAFIKGLNAALNPNAVARLREPDATLRVGSQSGYISAIQKPETERFADLVLNNDLLQTVLPTLEIIRYASPNRYLSRQGPRGRQIYQFAGVEVSSSYGIECLVTYDALANTCDRATEPPAAIRVSLTDTGGNPLAGGTFEVRQDVDADGVLGLKDTLAPDGACTTAHDGTGTCVFDALSPGAYLVSQMTAPPGYLASVEPFALELASGEQQTVTFANMSNSSEIDVKLTDESDAAISGASFAVYPDPAGDGQIAPGAVPAAECTTDAQGACSMTVPAGAYVLVQRNAPPGLELIQAVPLTFSSGAQVAMVTVVNYPLDVPQPSTSPMYDSAPKSPVPVVTVDRAYVAPLSTAHVIPGPQLSVPERFAGTITRVIRAPGDALRLWVREPVEAVAWSAALALLLLSATAVRRRQQALVLMTHGVNTA